MKQVKIGDVKKVLNISDNNTLVTLLMTGLHSESSLTKNTDVKKYCDKRWDKLYDLLDEVGYFDDCK